MFPKEKLDDRVSRDVTDLQKTRSGDRSLPRGRSRSCGREESEQLTREQQMRFKLADCCIRAGQPISKSLLPRWRKQNTRDG